MKTLLSISVLTFLALAAPKHCLALMEIADVSKERAKELSINVRSNVAGSNEVRVWLEFKTKGELAAFSHVELEITEGESRLVSARLLSERPTSDTIAVNFIADPANLAKSTLTVVVQPRPETRIGFRLKVKDFIQPEKSR